MSAPLTVLRATGAESPGANLRVAGLSALERRARQLGRQGHRVLIAIARGVAPPRPYYLPRETEVVTVGSEAEVAALAEARGAVAVVAADQVQVHGRDESGVHHVTDEHSRARAEDAIFGELLRGDLGLVARHLNKPVSFRITRHLLCHLPITPNQVTLGAALIGLFGAGLIATGERMSMLVGFFLAHVQSVLDGCDGELARVRLQQSPIGEWLDTLVDDGLNLALAVAIGVGFWRATGGTIYLVGGLAAAGMLLTYNVIAYRELVRQGEGGEVLKVRWWFSKGADLKQVIAAGRKGPLQALLTLGRRDFFILAWLLLALLDLPAVILTYILAIATINFLVAVIQIFARRPV